MKDAVKFAVLGAAFAALVVYSKRSNALVLDEASILENDVGGLPPEGELIFYEDDPTLLFGYVPNEMDTTDPARNVDAFLFMLRSAEHRFPDDVRDSDTAYRVFYGGSLFNSFADHPVNTKEKTGIPLPDNVCRNAGLNPGCVSTAAGAYQFTKPTWNNLRNRAPRLPDFSPASQDEAARRLLDEIGALPYIERGDFATAIKIAGSKWASLPGARGGQRQHTQEFALARIDEGLNMGSVG